MPNVLTINGGSSSIRFAIFAAGRPPRRLLQGKMDRLDMKGGATAVDRLLDSLESQPLFKTLDGVGHRVVHGMLHTEPERVTDELLLELKAMIPFDPEHLPREIELIEALR